jgi:hypothetical protein
MNIKQLIESLEELRKIHGDTMPIEIVNDDNELNLEVEDVYFDPGDKEQYLSPAIVISTKDYS